MIEVVTVQTLRDRLKNLRPSLDMNLLHNNTNDRANCSPDISIRCPETGQQFRLDVVLISRSNSGIAGLQIILQEQASSLPNFDRVPLRSNKEISVSTPVSKSSVTNPYTSNVKLRA